MTDISAISSTSSTDSGAAIDHSYSYRDTKSGPNLGVGSMGFDDFLDMINPLEHIPLVSSIYRAATGETINPLSRIAGDALYGGVFGLASAGIAAAGALGDEIFTASNDGKSASATVMAALFGGDDQNVQLADNTSAPDTAPAAGNSVASQPLQKAALLQTPARQSPILEIPNLSTATQTASATTDAIPSSTMTEAATFPPSATGAATNNGLPLDRTKLAYGGVMDTAMMQNALQNQSLALALMSGQDNMQAQRSVRNSRFSTATASPVTAPTAQSASLPLPGSSPSLTSWSGNNNTNSPNAIANALNPGASITSNLPGAGQNVAGQTAAALRMSVPQTGSAELKPIKGLDQYRATAQKVPMIGGTVDVTN